MTLRCLSGYNGIMSPASSLVPRWILGSALAGAVGCGIPSGPAAWPAPSDEEPPAHDPPGGIAEGEQPGETGAAGTGLVEALGARLCGTSEPAAPAAWGLGGGQLEDLRGDLAASAEERQDLAELGSGEVDLLLLCPGRHTLALDLTEGASLRIVGLGAPGEVVLDGEGERHLLSVDGGAELELVRLVLRGGSATEGGALACQDATLRLQEVSLLDNEAGRGGALHAQRCEVALDDVVLDGNEALGQGAGAWLRDSTLSLDEVRLDDHWGEPESVLYAEDSAITWRGGGAEGNEPGLEATVHLLGGTLEGRELELGANASRSGRAGVFTIEGYASVSLHDSQLLENLAGRGASVAKVESGSLRLYDSTVSENYSGPSTAVKLMSESASLWTSSSTFRDNEQADVRLPDGTLLDLGEDASVTCVWSGCT